MGEITFYMNPMSRARIVRWMLEEVGAPYKAEVLEYGTTMGAPEFLAVNPMGKVPTIVHDGAVVTETAAICTYLADTFPEAGLAPPPGTPERGAYYRWLFFGAGPVEQAVTNASMDISTDGDLRLQGRVGYGSLDRVCDALQGLLSDGRTHILGEKFSAVDVYTGSQIAWGLQFGTLPERPAFKPYVDRIISRPAAVRARELDDALLPEDAQSG